MASERGGVIRWKQIEDESKVFDLIFETGERPGVGCTSSQSGAVSTRDRSVASVELGQIRDFLSQFSFAAEGV
jgi:hypothetical protein